jgi:hypothetical protein
MTVRPTERDGSGVRLTGGGAAMAEDLIVEARLDVEEVEPRDDLLYSRSG